MAKTVTKKQILNNVSLSVVAQAVSLIISTAVSLIVPKFIDEFQYSYWQTFVLYSGYAGILHFGLLDGILLRYSQYDKDEIDTSKLRSLFLSMIIFLTSIDSLFVILSITINNINSSKIILLLAVSVITRNCLTYISYFLQITNQINRYIKIIITQRIIYGLIAITLAILKVNNFVWYCLAELIGEFVSIAIGLCNNPDFFFGKLVILQTLLKEIKLCITSGFVLMLSNWAAGFLLGSMNIIVQLFYGELIFGKVAFAFKINNLFLTFITAASIVLFPTLKRLDDDRLIESFYSLRKYLSPLLLFTLILYFPGIFVLKAWLPKYVESFIYIGLTLPIIVFSSKICLISNNYLKALRAEKKLLFINLISLVPSIVSFMLITKFGHNVKLLLSSAVFFIMLSSVLSDIAVMKLFQKTEFRDIIFEIAISVLFMIIVSNCQTVFGFFAYAFVLLIYYILNRKNIKELFLEIRHLKSST